MANRYAVLEMWRIAMLYSKIGENRSDHENLYELVGEYRDKYRYKLDWSETWPYGFHSAHLLSSAAVDDSIFNQIINSIIRSND